MGYRANNYDVAKRTIDVELPNHDRTQFPKDWEKRGNHYYTPNGCVVSYWGSGYGENFLVEHNYNSVSKHESTIVGPGLYAREMVIDIVNKY
jgi:hypothetical protein